MFAVEAEAVAREIRSRRCIEHGSALGARKTSLELRQLARVSHAAAAMTNRSAALCPCRAGWEGAARTSLALVDVVTQ